MADTSGFGHLDYSYGGGGPLNRTSVDLRLLAKYDRNSPPQDTHFFLPVHITFDEKAGYVSPYALREIQRQASQLKDWYGTGITGETFALQGNISRLQLAFISRLPGVKFVWLLNDRQSWPIKWQDIEA
ncbi:MAG: hypothetical protein K2X29_14420 [Candidatus Obscuribacterales bacterium]|nr:hypothetical protein [Candidatus Obscuribacterales bacterium]